MPSFSYRSFSRIGPPQETRPWFPSPSTPPGPRGSHAIMDIYGKKPNLINFAYHRAVSNLSSSFPHDESTHTRKRGWSRFSRCHILPSDSSCVHFAGFILAEAVVLLLAPIRRTLAEAPTDHLRPRQIVCRNGPGVGPVVVASLRPGPDFFQSCPTRPTPAAGSEWRPAAGSAYLDAAGCSGPRRAD